MVRRCSFFGVAVFVAVAMALVGEVALARNTVWPQPKSIVYHASEPLIMLGMATFNFSAVGVPSDTLFEAFERQQFIIFGSSGPTRQSMELKGNSIVTGVDVDVQSSSEALDLDTDESYTLKIAAPRAKIAAKTVFGAMNALETFAQLTSRHGTFVEAASVVDEPRFRFRSTMIDTSRHWYPVSVILAHIDAMAYNKFNVLHWHPVDSVSFPFCSETFPEMCLEGSYTPSHIYCRSADRERVVNYAMKRGIRVIPEFDSPGHVLKGFETIPNLLTPCYGSDGKPDGTTGPINPILDSTYAFFQNSMLRLRMYFLTRKFTLGATWAVSFDCWQSNPIFSNG